MGKNKSKYCKRHLLIFEIICVAVLLLGFNHIRNTKAAEKHFAISSMGGDHVLLARLIAGEAEGEPFSGQVGVGAVILNRVRHPKFPKSVAGVIYQPGAFESVSNGHIWSKVPSRDSYKAAQQALNGWDPTYGCLYFWNPYKRVGPWIWTRNVVTQIGQHVFGR
jgi:N-acetylmuramoyl-L-alanine amidase